MKLTAGMRRLVAGAGAGLALMTAGLLPGANAQVTTTNVQGTVYRADGSFASGTLLVSWPAFSTATNQAVAAGSISTAIGPAGSVSLNLAPNSGAYPAGTYYTAVYHLNDGTVSREYWVVPATASTTISSVRAQLAPATVAVQPVSKAYVDSSITAVTGNYVPVAGGTMTGALQLNGDPASPNQAATKHYADVLAAAELPLGGGSLSGTLNTPNAVSKLPRVDVRHPDFGSGCPNAADPTGQQDSTCAIQAAVAWAMANPQGGAYPTVYFPAGTYKISAAIRASCYLHLVGDGEQATVIEPANNAANAFTIYNGTNVQPDLYTCNGSIENLSVYAPGGHNYTATLIELISATGYNIINVRGANSGGRGLATAGSTERLKVINTEWDTNRWSIVASGNELKFLDTQIASPGADASGYCWDINCVNGVFPPFNWTAAQKLISATGNGATATYVVKGGTDSGSTNGVSPMLAGNYFTVAGISDVMGLNGVYPIASVTNNSPISGEYTVTAANSTSGTATVTGATYKPTILPDNTAAAFYIAGAAVDVLGGSIKANWHQGCFQTTGVFSGLIQGFYCEGYPINGQPHVNSSLMANGMPAYTSTTGVIASSAVPVASTMWFPNYVNDPSDAGGIGSAAYRILPQDFVKGSSTASAYVAGVQQGQFENVTGIFSGDGKFHIGSRNQSGSTAPANTAWPSGSVIAVVPQGNYGTLEAADNHFESVDPPGANWAVDCNDATSLICGEAIVGSIPNGYTTFSASGSGSGGANISVSFDKDEWWGIPSAATETVGQGLIKVSGIGQVSKSDAGTLSGNGETYEAVKGQLLNSGNVYAVTEADGSTAGISYTNPNTGQYVNSFNSNYEGIATDSSVTGDMPFRDGLQHQFASGRCWSDIPPSGQSHALNRFCEMGAPNQTDYAQVGLEYDYWTGTAWQTVWRQDQRTSYFEGVNGAFNTNATTSSASSTFNGPGVNGDIFHYWNGTADTPIKCGWQFTSNQNSTTVPTGITKTYACNWDAGLTLPLTFKYTVPAGSVMDLSGFDTVKLPAGTTVNNQTVTFTIQSGAGTGATVGSCETGYDCSPSYGIFTYTTGTSPTAAAQVKLSWTTGYQNPPVCLFQQDEGLPSISPGMFADTLTTEAILGAHGVPAANTTYTIVYSCGN